ncbi:MAG: hypothetical protein ABI550_02045 [Ignavibacteriaceae bacterium]
MRINMIANKFKIFFAVFLLSFGYAAAQNKSDSTSSGDEWESFKAMEDSLKESWGDFDMGFLKNAHPTLSLNFGLSKISLKNFTENFAKPNLIELQIGYTDYKSKLKANIFEQNYRFASLSYISTKLSGGVNSPNVESNLWRIGLEKTTGLGYEFKSFSVIPFNSNSLQWSNLDIDQTITNSNDKNLIDLYNKTFCFGTGFKGGVQFLIAGTVSLDASYERTIIFSRHLFWKWAGSALIETSSQWILDAFINEILKSSPYAAPVISFLLKNALSYGMYELRQEKMNWPFKSGPPLAYDEFKFGVSFVF